MTETENKSAAKTGKPSGNAQAEKAKPMPDRGKLPADAARTARTALVLFSGGQDSSLCLAYALENFAHVETLGFDYGQTHQVEMACRDAIRTAFRAHFPAWAARLGTDYVLPLPALAQIGASALTGQGEIKMEANGLPSTFVPGRNLLFLTYAAALAYRRGHNVLVGGMCETDFSGYPDCRRTTLDSLEQAINQGMESEFLIDTPLMYIDKAGSWEMTHILGGDALIDIILEHSHSCYRGIRTKRYDWGYGCNDCPACSLRAKGWQTWQRNRQQEQQERKQQKRPKQQKTENRQQQYQRQK